MDTKVLPCNYKPDTLEIYYRTYIEIGNHFVSDESQSIKERCVTSLFPIPECPSKEDLNSFDSQPSPNKKQVLKNPTIDKVQLELQEDNENGTSSTINCGAQDALGEEKNHLMYPDKFVSSKARIEQLIIDQKDKTQVLELKEKKILKKKHKNKENTKSEIDSSKKHLIKCYNNYTESCECSII